MSPHGTKPLKVRSVSGSQQADLTGVFCASTHGLALIASPAPGRRPPRALSVREPKQRARASPASIPLSASTGASHLQVPVRVEPKTYFANERTFLSWLNMAVLLSSVAVGLIGLGGSDDLATKYARIVARTISAYGAA